jgi:hypothetical protein
VYDACVLYPAPLRDLLVRLARTGLFRAKWTDQIHEEWVRNVLKNRPDLGAERLARTRQLMDDHVRDCKVTGHMHLVPSLVLPDENDRHVLAAAIKAGAQAILTFNRRDFPPEVLNPLGIEPQHPDEFVMHLIDLNAGRVCEVLKAQRASLKKPPMAVDAFLDMLERQQLPMSVERLRELAHPI